MLFVYKDRKAIFIADRGYESIPLRRLNYLEISIWSESRIFIPLVYYVVLDHFHMTNLMCKSNAY